MIDDLPPLTLLAAPVVTAAIATEWWAVRTGRARGRYKAPHAVMSMVMGAGNVAISSATALFTLWVLKAVSHIHVWNMPDTVWIAPLIFLIHDFLYYWKHRFGHEMRFFWTEHVTHHSSPDYNLTTALRQPWTGPLTGLTLTGIPMVLAGASPSWVIAASGFHLAYQFWIHTEAIDRMPRWFEFVFNTPSHHRVHHATNPRYLDSNFGGTLIIWDRLFGTFVPELERDRPVYGVFKPVETRNPLVVAYHEVYAFARDIVRDGWSPSRWVMRSANRPGWTAHGEPACSRAIKRAYIVEHPDQAGTPGLSPRDLT